MSLEVETLKQLFTRYQALLPDMYVNGDCLEEKCDANSLNALCTEAITNCEHYPLDKMHRWLGFVQGVLAAKGIITVDVERDFTRPLFKAVYDEKGVTSGTYDSMTNIYYGSGAEPLMCRGCGSTHLLNTRVMDDGQYVTEFDVQCLECGDVVSQWAFGSYDPYFTMRPEEREESND